MTCLIVHLSDLHIDMPTEERWSKDRAQLIARSAVRKGPQDLVLLIASGDIAYAGRSAEYEVAEGFFEEIKKEIELLAQCPVMLLVAAGNHDCDFSVTSKLRTFARTQLIQETINDPEMLEKLVAPLANFRSFENRVESFDYSERGQMQKSGIVFSGDLKIQVRVWNSALFSEIKEKKGELFLTPSLFETGWQNDCLRISVMHHPPSWFTASASRSIRTALRKHAHILLFGHEHFPEVGEIATHAHGRHAEAIEVDGAVLQPHGTGNESSFITLEIEAESNSVSVMLHDWAEAEGVFETKSLTDLNRNDGWMNIPRKIESFAFSPAFEERLRDPGISVFTKSNKKVTAVDLYTYPDFSEKISSKSNAETIFSGEVLLKQSQLVGGVVLQGDEKAGKTAFLFRVFESYHSAGLLPVYICLKDHKIKNVKDFQKILETSLQQTYPHETLHAFAAIPKAKRIFLLDDIDVLTKPELRTELVRFLRAQCDCFMATTTLRTQLAEVLTEDDTGAVGQIRQIKWVRLSYQKRSQLISKWVKIVEQVEDQEEFLSRLDSLEKSASITLGNNLVPRVPHMLLIFLHASSGTSQAKLESGALASYYNYLVTGQLLGAGVKSDEVDEYISFARVIAYFMHSSEKTYVSTDDVEVCNATFSSEFYPGHANARLNILRNAGLLMDYGSDAYQWRHSYLHYLFLGGYLGTNNDRPEVVDAIQRMCKHLYVRANANALLFLVHFNKDRMVFSALTEVLGKLFESDKPLCLGEDTREFNLLVRDAKNLFLPEDGVIAERDKMNRSHDSRDDDRGDGFSEKENSDDAITVLEELIVLFKTSEILGQVLKEQYASINRSTREPIVVALLDAYRRASGGIIRKLAANKELIRKSLQNQNGVGQELTEQKRAEKAQIFVSELVQMFMFAFFQKLGDCIASDKTLDLIRNIKWTDELEPQVFLLACELNLQRSLPFARIDNLLLAANNDTAFVALIRNLVQVRVSIFHTKAQELQALASRFKVDVNSLTAIEFRESKKR